MAKKSKGSEEFSDLSMVIKRLNAEFGDGTIMPLDGSYTNNAVDVVPSGCMSLDVAMGIGGFPRGRIVEIYGPESSGKTTLALHVIAEAQKQGHACAFIDAEHAIDLTYTSNIGVDVANNFYVSQPDYGEQALTVLEDLVRTGMLAVIVVDSVAALVPKSELEGEMGDSHMGLQARLMSQALRKINGVVSKSNTCVIFINQLRDKIGVMFGSPETTTGGRALKFYASMRLDIRRIATFKVGKDAVGNRTRVKVVKNKLAPPFKECEFDIVYSEGISKLSDFIDLAVERGYIQKNGMWYYMDGEQFAQGRDNAINFFKQEENTERFTSMYAEMRKDLLGNV